MTEKEELHWGFLPEEEILSSSEFIEKGYLIVDVESNDSLKEIRHTVVDIASSYLGVSANNDVEFLNDFHTAVTVTELNDIRLHLIRSLNSEKWFRKHYWTLVRPYLETLVGNELAMQLRINLSIQLPGDDSSLLPVHSDVWSGDSPFEVVVWIPLVDCYGTKSMYILPPEKSEQLSAEFSQHAKKSSEELFLYIEPNVNWIQIQYGKALIFNQNLPHGNRLNQESETRWSLNCRFKSVFSPYGDKKLGEYFEPITLRAASFIGMNYRYPKTTS